MNVSKVSHHLYRTFSHFSLAAHCHDCMISQLCNNIIFSWVILELVVQYQCCVIACSFD